MNSVEERKRKESPFAIWPLNLYVGQTSQPTRKDSSLMTVYVAIFGSSVLYMKRLHVFQRKHYSLYGKKVKVSKNYCKSGVSTEYHT